MGSLTYRSLNRILPDLSNEGRKKLIGFISEGGFKLVLNTESDLGFSLRIRSDYFLNKKYKTYYSKIDVVKIRLSQVLCTTIQEIEQFDYSKSYTFSDLIEMAPSLENFFTKKYGRLAEFILDKNEIFDLLLRLNKCSDKEFLVGMRIIDIAFLGEYFKIAPTKSKPGKKPDIFSDEFYDHLFIALRMKNSHATIDTVVGDLLQWQRILEPDETKWKHSESKIVTKVKNIYRDLRMKSAK